MFLKILISCVLAREENNGLNTTLQLLKTNNNITALANV